MSKTQKRFAKGDTVTLFGDWDRRGSVYYRHAVVYACGPKRMTLTCQETGDELGRNFDTHYALVTPRMTEAEAVAHALQLAALLLESEREHFQRCLLRHSTDTGYCASIQRSLDALHEPRAKRYIDGGE